MGVKREKREGRKERVILLPLHHSITNPKPFLEINKGLESGDTALTQRDRQIPEPCRNIKNAKVLWIFLLTSFSPQTTPSRNKHIKKFPLFINPYSKPLSRFHLLLISLRVTSQIKNSLKFSFNYAPERLSLWMFISAVEAGPFEGTACQTLLRWGKEDKRCGEQKSVH